MSEAQTQAATTQTAAPPGGGSALGDQTQTSITNGGQATAQNGAQSGAQNGASSGQQQTQQTNGAAQTVANGATQQDDQNKPYWPEDWREKLAEHSAAGDKKAYEKELRRLQNMDSPVAAWSSFRNMENTWASRKFIKLPGEDAKPEELAEYHKALGVPEKPEDYFKSIKLESGAVIGEQDKPMVDSFTAEVHKVGAPPAVVNAALNWYFKNQEQQAAALDESDEKFKTESQRALKDEWGPSFKRRTNAVATLFDVAPGGADVKNPNSLYARLLGGRTADGKIIGDDPDMVRWLSALAFERNPAATVVEDGDQTGKSVEAEISEIEGVMKNDRPRYNKDTKMQGRYLELLEARSKIRAKAR